MHFGSFGSRTRVRSAHTRRRLATYHGETLEPRQLLALTVAPIPVANITLDSATIGAEMSGAEGAEPQLVFYWGNEDGGTVGSAWDNAVFLGPTPEGTHTTELTGLAINTTYFYRAYALNLLQGSLAWSELATFATLPPQLAEVELNDVRLASESAAELSGSVLSTGGETPTATIYYGTSDAGEDASAWTHSISLGMLDQDFTHTLTGLAPQTTYSVRFAASNSGGTQWSEPVNFTTQAAEDLRISEVMSANGSTAMTRSRPNVNIEFYGPDQAYDWIEIQNTTDAEWNLAGFGLSDDGQQPLKWQFPAGATVPAHGFLLVYASGEDIHDPALDEQSRFHTNFRLGREGETIFLSSPDGTVIHEMAIEGDQYRDVSYGFYGQALGHLAQATPLESNVPVGPRIDQVEHHWDDVAGETNLLVTAHVARIDHPVAEVMLHYRAMFGDTTHVVMADNGIGHDQQAGDGIFTAAIPGEIAAPGEMIRYFITANSTLGVSQRAPMFVDEDNSPEYFGTIVEDPELASNMPILHRFIEEPRRAESGRGTRVSVYYGGEFYDNAFIRIRGGTARNWPKKSYKLEFNDDHHFLLNEETPRVDEVNLNATYTDKSYLRARLTSEFQLAAGLPSPETFHLRMEQNGEFFSIGFVVEQPDRDFLRRHGMDADGSLYKAGPGSYYTRGSESAFEKKTREYEDKSDLTELIVGLQLRDDDEREAFLFENVDLATQINFMATNVIAQNIDASDKNHFVYRDTNGTGQWHMLPWDLDLVFGPDALNTDYIAADQNTAGATYPTAVHPFLGSRRFPLHAGKINMLLDGIITTPRTTEMFLRRVRTLADDYLSTGYFHDRIDELVTLLADEVPLDRETWGRNAHFGGTAPAFEVVADRIKTMYLDRRLPYLTEYHVTGGVGIPESQPDQAPLEFGTLLESAPDSGLARDEFLTIVNPNSYAVDLSGWQIEGAIQHSFKPGTVLAAGDTLFLTTDVAGFLQTNSDGVVRYAQAINDQLPDSGGSLQLINEQGLTIAQRQYGTEVVAANSTNLRISEVNFDPPDGFAQFGEFIGGGANFEFVEVRNVSDQPIELAGVEFAERLIDGSNQGIQFVFGSQILEPGEHLVVTGNRAAFESRYGMDIQLARGNDGLGGLDGEFNNRLNNGGETLTLLAADGSVIQQFRYDDTDSWPVSAQGYGSSIQWRGPAFDPATAEGWQASRQFNGSPGSAEDIVPTSVVINEILTNPTAPGLDQIELFNPSNEAVSLAGWYLSDGSNDLLRYQFSPDISIAARGFLVLDEQELGFAFNGTSGDLAFLITADDQGRPNLFADQQAFGATELGVSWGRVPDGQGEFRPLPETSFGQSNAGDPTRGDFNGDGTRDASDLDLLCAAIHDLQIDDSFDLTNDGLVNQSDLETMVRDILGTGPGDANLDGVFNSRDLVLVFQAGEYEDDLAGNSGWSTGDWNCDGEFNTSDLVTAFTNNQYSQAAAPRRRL